MVTGAVAEMPGTPLPTDRYICPRPALYPSSAQGAWRAAASHVAPWRIFRARRRPEEGSELKPAMGAKCCRKAPLESLKLAAVMPRNDSDTKDDRPREVANDQAGSSQPRSVWGTIVASV
jgi:hypothetical protein